MKESKRHQCDTCHHWRGEDLSPLKVGNLRSCTYMLPQTKKWHGSVTHVPYWATRIVRQTLSFDGVGCGTWKNREVRGQVAHENPTLRNVRRGNPGGYAAWAPLQSK